MTTEVGTHPSYKDRKNKRWSKSIKKEKGKKTKSKVVLSVLSILGKQVRDNSGSHALTVGPSGIMACVLLWEHPQPLGVYLLLAHGTRRQSHHKVVYKPTPKSNNRIPNGASFDTAITI